MAIRAVIWDIDDTLFDYDTSDRDAALAHLEAEGCLDGYASPAAAHGHWRTVMEEHFGRFLAREITFTEQRRARARAVLAVTHPDLPALDDAAADAWFARYDVHFRDAWRLFPDVLPALDALAAYRHGILSNAGFEGQLGKLRAFSLEARFDAVLCADQLPRPKPAPEAFHAACSALGVSPVEAAYVGDRPDTDAGAAAAAGLTGVWIDRTGGSGRIPPAVIRIRTLAELPSPLSNASCQQMSSRGQSHAQGMDPGHRPVISRYGR
ncbi:Phosphoglycolate phosphatase [Streptomyces sp. RB5]|uniref:Phosphoglycolate phosphatase n=1 Tax=Streptomyces smaragdinus TaxID=2585196 RepID=A0A7K0CJ63_9ACTN|nr:HAD family hydrolase [Streptomyces smaragdinus]MQY13498.1 Phosphoglycolate phosphatase [Streptomyces smaragdinus]